MDAIDFKALNDDALNAFLFGVVYDCLPGCPEQDCPLTDLPRDSLSATFDALVAMPRVEKLALLLVPQECPSRDHGQPQESPPTTEAPHDILHLLEFYAH